ncbi:MAG: uroporphyrinogen-III synthase [Myxococcota bacterium]
MGSGPEVLILASAEVGDRVSRALERASVRGRVLELLTPVYRPFPFEPEAWDGLVIGSIHGWRGLRPAGPFAGPCFAVGARTAERLEAEARDSLKGPLLVPDRARAEGLVALVRAHFEDRLSGARLLLPRTEQGRTLAQEALGAVASVEAPSVYSMQFGPWPQAEDELETAWALVCGSGEVLRRVVDRVGVDGLRGRRLFVFGPAGLEVARGLGLEAQAPASATAEAVAALVVADRRSD